MISIRGSSRTLPLVWFPLVASVLLPRSLYSQKRTHYAVSVSMPRTQSHCALTGRKEPIPRSLPCIPALAPTQTSCFTGSMVSFVSGKLLYPWSFSGGSETNPLLGRFSRCMSRTGLLGSVCSPSPRSAVRRRYRGVYASYLLLHFDYDTGQFGLDAARIEGMAQ